MASHGQSFGVEPGPIVQLPAPCIGHPLKTGTCTAEGTITLVGVVEAPDGSPTPVLCSVCPRHARAARHWLEQLGHGDEVQVWATRTLFEHNAILEDADLNWHHVVSA